MLFLSAFKHKNIIVGISGGIAAYKSASLVREFKKEGANVKVIMTTAAKSFITPLTLQALSGEEVCDQLIDTKAEAGMGHIELARWADLIVIAPASANLISQLAQGSASHLLTTICLASTAPIIICPAMNKHMWLKPIVQRNMKTLSELGIETLGPVSGEQACGDVGLGRMSEVSDIMPRVERHFLSLERASLQGKKVLITLGPTREYLDPVRYITNESSGLMGHSLAVSALNAGAEVTVIAGPNQLIFSSNIKLINVVSANEMFDAVVKNAQQCDVFISTAAVSDYRPQVISQQKVKKKEDELSLSFIKNKDILAHVGLNQLCPFIVGFAAETNNVKEYAKAKLLNKGLDLIVANQVGIAGSGFNSAYNQVTVFNNKGDEMPFDKMKKEHLAPHLIELIAKEYEGS